MRLFSQSLSGEVKKWFMALQAANIPFETSFLAGWGDKKNPLQLLIQYNNIKRSLEEIVQDLLAKFMKVYNSIPMEVKPLPRATQL
jgi:hypothetical protein